MTIPRAHPSAGSNRPGRRNDSRLVLSADPLQGQFLYPDAMVDNALRALWAEPRPSQSLGRAWYDWVLVAVLVSGTVVEVALRHDLTWRPVMLAVGVVVALTLSWRRRH